MSEVFYCQTCQATQKRWDLVPDWPDYSVSDHGDIFSNRRFRPMKPGLNDTYLKATLSKGGLKKIIPVHRMVARAFVAGYEPGLTVNHIDFNKMNNCYRNLEWITALKNIEHAVANGSRASMLGELHPSSKLTSTQVINIRHAHDSVSVRQLARLYRVTPQSVSSILKRQTWKHV
jgi:ribose 1,5-bisphosphokinase PhnN